MLPFFNKDQLWAQAEICCVHDDKDEESHEINYAYYFVEFCLNWCNG